MKKQIYFSLAALFFFYNSVNAAVGDTTWVQSFNGQLTQPGAFNTSVGFPDGSTSYRKIYMIFTLGEYSCPSGSQYCHQWDYDVENYLMTPAGDTLELARFITPYATSGTPGFGATWQQHYIFDVTDYYKLLKDSATMQIYYSGYSYGFNGDVKFAFIEGSPERDVLGYSRLWNNTYTYGNPNDPIDNHVTADTITPPTGTQSTEMKFAITGHGYDNTSGCCEFDNTGVGHTYYVLSNGNTVAQYNMNVTCGESEIYPQGGTWAYTRAGNWCPGGSLTVAQYKLNGFVAGSPNSVDVNFDDSYDGGGAYGIYKIASAAFYYGGYNKVLDASLEDIVAPTSFEWYKRENPRASVPVVKVRNTGGDTIHTILFQYGMKDSVMQQYIWVGMLMPSQTITISMPALQSITNLSLAEIFSGQNINSYDFTAQILQVNGQTDNDQSNDMLTSTFKVAPTWPYTFLVKMLTNSWGTNGLGVNPSAASWQIMDANNSVVASRTNANITTTYADTVTLNTASYYALTVSTTNCSGLSWWADAQGYGSSYTAGSFAVQDYNNFNAVLPLNGDYTGTYHDDFGCGFTQYFTTAGGCQAATPAIIRAGHLLTASSGYVHYQWYVNDTLIHGATDSIYSLSVNNENYTVEATDANGCIGIASSIAIADYSGSFVGVNSISDPASVRLAPNPANNSFTLYVNGDLIGSAYTISDLTGRDIAYGRVSSGMTQVSVANITSGVYMVNVSNGAGSITKRVVIAK
jgi:hypothetical protein